MREQCPHTYDTFGEFAIHVRRGFCGCLGVRKLEQEAASLAPRIHLVKIEALRFPLPLRGRRGAPIRVTDGSKTLTVTNEDTKRGSPREGTIGSSQRYPIVCNDTLHCRCRISCIAASHATRHMYTFKYRELNLHFDPPAGG